MSTLLSIPDTSKEEAVRVLSHELKVCEDRPPKWLMVITIDDEGDVHFSYSPCCDLVAIIGSLEIAKAKALDLMADDDEPY